MNLEQLQNQLKSFEAELEAARAAFFRAEGAIIFIKHLIREAEQPQDAKPE